MSDHLASLVLEMIGGILGAPLLPGLIQSVKGKLQGRQGPSPLQPYRELARLAKKSTVDPTGSSVVYRSAPAISAAALLAGVAIVPLSARGTTLFVGHDAIVLVGVLGVSGFSVALAAFDTGSGFGLMGASRHLAISVFVEALLLLSIVLASLSTHSTDLAVMSQAGAGLARWGDPYRICAALSYGLVVIAETGRQPIDNPDTHLELTMIHEGPVLEYAGMDQALLQWSAAAEHWVLLVVAITIFLPHSGSLAGELASLVIGLPVLCVVIAIIETWQAKLRILAVPRLLGAGSLLALVGFVTFFVAGRS